MKTSTIVWIAGIVIVLLGAWYFFAMPKTAVAPVPQPEQGTTVHTNPTGNDYVPGNLLLGVDSNATLGKYLIGSNGMTLYTYAPDTAGVSNCTGACATNWPPYTIADMSVLANIQAGITGKADIVTRAYGTMQVTYNGRPLYFYSGDTQSGDTKGNLANHAAWNVAKP